jgi:hypothetical protein
VIRRDDQQIVAVEFPDQCRQTLIESLQVLRITFHVIAMAVLRIEIHEVREDHPARLRRQQRFDLVDTIGVALGGVRRRNPLAREQVRHFPTDVT